MSESEKGILQTIVAHGQLAGGGGLRVDIKYQILMLLTISQ